MPKYGKAAGRSVRRAMRRKKHGTLRSGKQERRTGEKPEASDCYWALRSGKGVPRFPRRNSSAKQNS